MDTSVAALLTVGEPAVRTGPSRKEIREPEDRGLVYSVGRSDSNCRLFDETALWCVRTIGELRARGLTLTEIEQLRDEQQPSASATLSTGPCSRSRRPETLTQRKLERGDTP